MFNTDNALLLLSLLIPDEPVPPTAQVAIDAYASIMHDMLADCKD